MIEFREDHKIRSINYFKKGKSFRTAAMNSEFTSTKKDFTESPEELINAIKVILDERIEETKNIKIGVKKESNSSIIFQSKVIVFIFVIIFVVSCYFKYFR